MNTNQKLTLSKETLRSLNARPLSDDEIQQVGGAFGSESCDDGTFTVCAGSTGCSTFTSCPMR